MAGDQEPFAGLDSDMHEPEPDGAHSAVDLGEPHADSTTSGEQWEVEVFGQRQKRSIRTFTPRWKRTVKSACERRSMQCFSRSMSSEQWAAYEKRLALSMQILGPTAVEQMSMAFVEKGSQPTDMGWDETAVRTVSASLTRGLQTLAEQHLTHGISKQDHTYCSGLIRAIRYLDARLMPANTVASRRDLVEDGSDEDSGDDEMLPKCVQPATLRRAV